MSISMDRVIDQSLKVAPHRGSLTVTVLAFLLIWSQHVFAAVSQAAQEWTSDAVAGVYSSKASVLAAVHAKGGLYAMATDLEKISRDANSIATRYTYGTGPKALVVGPWSFLAAPGRYSTEAEATAAELNWYTGGACGGGSLTPQADWYRISEFGNSGVNYYEARMYTLRWRNLAENCATEHSMSWQLLRDRAVACPTDLSWDSEMKACRRKQVFSIVSRPMPCSDCDLRDNPIDVNIAEKYQREVDFELPFLTFSRHYHSSHDALRGRLGPGWSHSLNLRLQVFAGSDSGLLQADDGSMVPFHSFEAIDSSEWRFRATSRGYEVSRRELNYVFNAEMLQRVEWQDGRYLALTYDEYGRLVDLIDQSGRSIHFSYTDTEFPAAANIKSVASGIQTLVEYEYDSAGRLATVRYADGTSKQYHYENVAFPDSLTGITDENGVRFATFAYDALGRPISTEHAGGVNRGEFAYLESGATVHKDPNGNEETVSFDAQGTYRKVGTTSDSRGTVSITYAPPGSNFQTPVTERRDRLGTITTYTYADYNDSVLGPVRSTTVKEAAGTPLARTRQEIRDRTYANLLRVVVADRQISYTRNTRGQILARTEQSIPDGATRTTTQRYCEQVDIDASLCPRLGLLLEVDGPRSDVGDVSTFEYYMSDDLGCATAEGICRWRKGDLWKVTNAKGHVTESLRYDVVGRLLSARDGNGVITDFEYDPRGRLIGRRTHASN